ncbi:MULTISPECIES: hypothetical protein [unclassified Saccharopolyspora]|uniref:hypothetical protein n=1 Tax=unclassified Saccharopolyspora TaxID=2646250 RepID=UPI001CD3D07E|nr:MULTISPECIES: hypothetical protein [unclassified Saccharopolyspora]MCA1184876.1 hypothetical protein [Saccharopolyspora sp. 6T]MCA1190601.1 hypothetical protein [Saccharopolyspora sp. 6V]MCA1226471.1 hypothetical protein [Saccharopolyspora sp. 6M]MCA1283076.1 hypothetical protein [Saccharopolyspora sp. 7B]
MLSGGTATSDAETAAVAARHDDGRRGRRSVLRDPAVLLCPLARRAGQAGRSHGCREIR